jgi:outer membrane protein OmpA-like peptidoglycan-associated protein
MIKKFLLSVLFIATCMSNLHASVNENDRHLSELLQPLSPTYVNDAVVHSWLDNWFIQVAGGASSFIGSPIGCEDLFGCMKPTLQIGIGKWYTPSVGNRVVFQGFQWKSGELLKQSYRHLHADLLWNVTPSLKDFDVIPLIGVGIIDNCTADRRPFAFNYGVMGRYRLTDYLHLTAEISNATTFKDADGLGSARQLGDHHLSLTAGLSLTFGRHIGWRKVVDATPYIRQNERLSAYAYSLRQRNEELSRAYNDNARIVAELRKIMDIEGLLDKYLHCFDITAEPHSGYPVNDYSGLNSLRKRLREGGKDIQGTHSGDIAKNDTINLGGALSSVQSSVDLTDCSLENHDCLGAPIFFFFELGTTNLVNDSQLVNLNEIARIAKKFNLKIDVVGAADSQTGTSQINSNLGVSRSQYIAGYLTSQGVPAENIASRSDGGIDTYSPTPANRNATVRLYLP